MHDGIMRNLALIKEMEDFSDFSSVLDVGGGGRSHKDFFPDKDFHVLNIFKSTEDPEIKFTLASAANMPFQDYSFDLVVSSDTLEHIPAEDRTNAIDEMIRVAKKRVYLFVPCDEVSEKYESKILKIGLLFKRNMRWLSEHKECGLPRSLEIQNNILKNNQVSNLVIKNNHNLNIWFLGSLMSPLIRFIFSNSDRTKLIRYWKFWNMFNYGKKSYRKVFVIDKKLNENG